MLSRLSALVWSDDDQLAASARRYSISRPCQADNEHMNDPQSTRQQRLAVIAAATALLAQLFRLVEVLLTR